MRMYAQNLALLHLPLELKIVKLQVEEFDNDSEVTFLLQLVWARIQSLFEMGKHIQFNINYLYV